MARLDLNLETFVFPVNKKVRYEGKALSKFDVAWYLDVLQPSMCWTIIYDVFSYDELKDNLKAKVENALSSRN